MKAELDQIIKGDSIGQGSRQEPVTGFFYEVSRRPKNRRKKLFAPSGTGLFSPSGARVPPAWTHIWITTDPGSPIQAIGRDSKGRRVYLYSVEHTGRAAAAKFSRLREFAKAYPSLVKKLRRDKKASEEALVLDLISKTGFRIGSDSETKASVKAFGASTLLCSHVQVEGTKLTFDFTGKKGVRVRKDLKDAFLARHLSVRCDGSTDRKLFRTTDDEVRAYLSSISKGAWFTVKDFRTYLATVTAFRKIKSMPVPSNQKEFKRFRREVGTVVAGELGNSPAIALKSYVSPEVFCAWQSGFLESVDQPGNKRSSLSDEFLECIHYDRDVPMSEWPSSEPLD
jgi:DNA topoisomerase I